VIVRAERRRRAYTSAEIRERLQARLAESPAAPPQLPGPAADVSSGSWLRRPLRRWRTKA